MVEKSNEEIASEVMEESDGIELDMEEEVPDDSEDEINLWDRLTNNENSKPLSEIESAWDPENGGPTRIKRGVSNLAGVSSLAIPLYDIPVGIAETAYQYHSDKFSLTGDSETENQETENRKEPRNETEEAILNA